MTSILSYIRRLKTSQERRYAQSYLDHLSDGTPAPLAIQNLYDLSPSRANRIRASVDERWNQVLEVAEVGEDVSEIFQVFPSIVKSPCEDKHNGKWYCLTHREIFDTQFSKDCHIQHGKHRMLWLCFEHGPEKP